MPLSIAEKKRLRAIGHHLKPVVLIGGDGLTEGVVAEINRALEDHELIKVKIHGEDREAKQALIAELPASTGAEVIQTVGKIALLYRPARKPNPRLSNLLRYQHLAG
jgi:RNA-binding protein